MKFWLIIFFLNPQGEFLSKQEVQYASKFECQKAQAGRKQDPGVDYD